MKHLLVLVFGGVFLLSIDSGWATIAIVDQQNAVGGGTLSASTIGSGLGQSFTPSLTSVNVADFSLLTSSSATLRLDIFNGAGYSGTLLGSSAPVTFTNTSLQTIEFSFSSAVALTVGSPYTFRLTLLAGSYSAAGSASNPYAGGSVWDVSGNAVPSTDAVFAEGIQAVPEPAASSLLLWGGAAILWRVKGISLRSRRG